MNLNPKFQVKNRDLAYYHPRLCITTNRHDKGQGCTSTCCVSIGGFYNHQVNSTNMKGAKTETVENIQNILVMNKLGPIQAIQTKCIEFNIANETMSNTCGDKFISNLFKLMSTL